MSTKRGIFKSIVNIFYIFVVAEMSNLNIFTSKFAEIYLQTELFVNFIIQTRESVNSLDF